MATTYEYAIRYISPRIKKDKWSYLKMWLDQYMQGLIDDVTHNLGYCDLYTDSNYRYARKKLFAYVQGIHKNLEGDYVIKLHYGCNGIERKLSQRIVVEEDLEDSFTDMYDFTKDEKYLSEYELNLFIEEKEKEERAKKRLEKKLAKKQEEEIKKARKKALRQARKAKRRR